MTDLPPEAGLRLELLRAETLVRKEPHPLFLEPGEERDLTWLLGGGATLHGHAVIAETDAPLPGHSIWLVPATEVVGRLYASMKPVARSTTDDQGTFTFPDVSPGEGVVIGPGQSVADVEVPLEPGAILLIKYTGEQPFADHSVISGGFPWSMGRYDRGQTSRTVGVPGEVVVSVTYETPDGQSHTVERVVDLVAGEETEVEVGDE